MTRRKTLLSLILLFTLCLAAIVLTACGGSSGGSSGPHTHTYSEWVQINEATCVSEGTSERTCLECGYVETQLIKPTDHTYGEWSITTAPTCTSNGTRTRSCTHCGAAENESVDTIDHIEVVIPYAEPTCSEDGHEGGRECAICGAITVVPTTIPKTDHTYSTDWQYDSIFHWHDATCGHNWERTEQEMHNFVQDIAIDRFFAQGATCISLAEYYLSCKCGLGSTNRFSVGEYGEHVPVDIEEIIFPTCVSDGQQGGTKCMLCDEILVQPTPIPARGHDYGEWELTKPASCGVEGEEAKQCLACQYTETRSIAALVHDYANEWSSNATHHWYTCSNDCNMPKDKVEHQYNEQNICIVCDKERETEGLNYYKETVNGVSCYSVSAYNLVHDPVVYIPSTHDGLPVMKISNSAFRRCTWITKVVLPDTIVAIGALRANGNGGAFYRCTGLESINLPDNLELIGISTFQDCSSLGDIVIPDKVTIIGGSAFSDCGNLTGTLTIGKSVETIGSYAFARSKFIGGLTIPDSVKTIDDNAFYECIGFNGDLHLGKGIETIGVSVFYGCENLTGDIVIPNGVKTLNFYTFAGCKKLTSVVISNGVESIGMKAFGSCIGLTNVEISDSVTYISGSSEHAFWGAFEGCEGLKSVTLGKGIEKIEGDAFKNCSSLERVNHTGDLASWCKIEFVKENSNPLYYAHNLYFNGEPITNPVIPESVTKINDYAFRYCTNITGTLTLSNRLTSIGKSAFYECKGLTGGLTIPDSVETIGRQAFYFCSGLNGDLSIGNGLQIIENFLFDNCSSLTGLTLGNSVKEIGISAFAECSSLTGELTIPDSVEKISSGAFDNCSSLTGLTLGNSVKEIGSSAFYGCSSLANSLIIPNSLTVIGEGGFRSCSGLTGLTLGNSVKEIGDNAFYYCTDLVGGLTIPDSVERIGAYAFYRCVGFTGDLAIPDSVTFIGEKAFEYCRGFNGNLTLGSNVEIIEDYAFDLCSQLTFDLKIPEKLTTIGERSFADLKFSSSNLIIPSSVTLIDEYAFGPVNKINTITVEEGNENYKSIDNCLIEIATKTLLMGCNGSIIPQEAAIEKIAAYAFNHYDGLFALDSPTWLEVPDTVTEIGKCAFANMNSCISAFVLPKSVTVVGESAFMAAVSTNIRIKAIFYTGTAEEWNAIKFSSYNPGIENAALYYYSEEPISVDYWRYVGDVPTAWSSVLKYTLNEDGESYTVEQGSSPLYNIVVPAEYNGKPVTTVSTFNRVKNLYLPDSVTAIKDTAFAYGEIESIRLSENLESIGKLAFAYCANLKSLVLPKSVKEIGYYAFSLSAIEEVYYTGNVEGWAEIVIDTTDHANDILLDATRYYYSEEQPTEEGNFWHYADGVVTKWESIEEAKVD